MTVETTTPEPEPDDSQRRLFALEAFAMMEEYWVAVVAEVAGLSPEVAAEMFPATDPLRAALLAVAAETRSEILRQEKDENDERIAELIASLKASLAIPSRLVVRVDVAAEVGMAEWNELVAEAPAYRVEIVLDAKSGPTGWPIVRVSGRASDVHAWLAIAGYDDGEYEVVGYESGR